MHGQLGLDYRTVADAPRLVLQEVAPPDRRGLLRFMTCGSVDDGKSTLIGRLLYDSELVFDDHLAALRKDSRRYGTQGSGLDFALLLDGLAAERTQGITIDVAYRYFSTQRRSFIVADAPGHEEYTRNMATGASTADLAVILVDVRKGILPQTRRHAFIVSMFGIRQVVLAVNKMDLVGFSESQFEEAASSFREATRALSFASIVAIPISASRGDNVTTGSSAMPWYRGPTLLQHLETVEPDGGNTDATFRMPVQWVSRPSPDFRGFAGTIVSGEVSPGVAVTVWPSGRRSTVDAVIAADRTLDRAVSGQAVTITLADALDVGRGDVVTDSEDAVTVSRIIEARVLWMAEAPLKPGASYLLKLGTRTASATVTKLHHAIRIADFLPAAAAMIGMNEIGVISIALDAPIVLTDHRTNRELGTFILIDRASNDTVALGFVDCAADRSNPPKSRPAIARMRRSVTALGSRIAGWLREARERPLRSVAKAITWRTTGSLDTFILSFIFTWSVKVSAAISATEIVTKLILYYWHERIWARSKFELSAGNRRAG